MTDQFNETLDFTLHHDTHYTPKTMEWSSHIQVQLPIVFSLLNHVFVCEDIPNPTPKTFMFADEASDSRHQGGYPGAGSKMVIWCGWWIHLSLLCELSWNCLILTIWVSWIYLNHLNSLWVVFGKFGFESCYLFHVDVHFSFSFIFLHFFSIVHVCSCHVIGCLSFFQH